MEIVFWSGTNRLGMAQYENQYLVWHKKFGPAQNILGPVEGLVKTFYQKWRLVQNLWQPFACVALRKKNLPKMELLQNLWHTFACVA